MGDGTVSFFIRFKKRKSGINCSIRFPVSPVEWESRQDRIEKAIRYRNFVDQFLKDAGFGKCNSIRVVIHSSDNYDNAHLVIAEMDGARKGNLKPEIASAKKAGILAGLAGVAGLQQFDNFAIESEYDRGNIRRAMEDIDKMRKQH